MSRYLAVAAGFTLMLVAAQSASAQVWPPTSRTLDLTGASR